VLCGKSEEKILSKFTGSFSNRKSAHRHLTVLTLAMIFGVSSASSAEEGLDCIHQEPVQAVGSTIRGPNLSKDTKNFLCKASLEGWQSDSESGYLRFTSKSSNALGEPGLGDHVTYEVKECDVRRGENVSFLNGKPLYHYSIRASGIKNHAPSDGQYLSGITKTYTLHGVKKTEIELKTRMRYTMLGGPQDELERECSYAGGTLVDFQRVRAGASGFEKMEGDRATGSGTMFVDWTGRGICKGNFYYFGEEPGTRTQKLCESDVSALFKSSNVNADCKYVDNSIKRSPLFQVVRGLEVELAPRISKEPEQKVQFFVST
jgi:hypothetical protein